MLGKGGVDLANAYDDADHAITDKNNEIRDVRKTLTAYVVTSQLDQFIALEADADITKKPTRRPAR
jgi:hypothetical protein